MDLAGNVVANKTHITLNYKKIKIQGEGNKGADNRSAGIHTKT